MMFSMTDKEEKSQSGGKMRGGKIPADDLRLLKEMMKDVTPLDGKEIAAPVKENILPDDDAVEEDIIEMPQPVAPKQKQKRLHENKEPGHKGSEQGLDKRSDERLRRGQMPIEARLDLHGMRQEEARAALERFLVQAQGQGKRCVLVITGKGKMKSSREDWLTSKPGVLKQKLPGWLEGDKLRGLVLKTYPAKPQHGGDGALYVLLRRKRG